jgi:hypothetical protein
MKLHRWAFVAAAVLLSACQTAPQNQGDPASVSEVVGKIKQDLEEYQKYDAVASAAKPLPNACGGVVGFSIDNVKISLTTLTDDKTGANGGPTLPVGAGTLAITFGGSQEIKGTQALTFTVYPKTRKVSKSAMPKAAPAPIDADKYPIAASLQRLREGLLAASNHPPCISLVPPDGPDGKSGKDDGGTTVFGFTVINEKSSGATLKFVVFSLGATNTSQAQAGNTITVTFKARGNSASAIYSE